MSAVRDNDGGWTLLSTKTSGIRVGELSSASSSQRKLATPACLAITETGGIPNLSPAQSQLLPPHGLVLLVPHYHLSFEAIDRLSTLTTSTSRPRRSGIAGYSGLSEGVWVHLALGESHPAPSGVSCDAPTGRFQLKPAEYSDIVRTTQPDSFSSLSWPVSSAAGQAGKNLMKRSCDKTIEWAAQQAPSPASIEFRGISGGASLLERERGASEVARDGRAFEILGLGTGEAPEARAEILRACTSRLPPNTPRLVAGLGSPEEVLFALEHGIDVIVTDYPTSVTSWGLALTFPFDEPLAPKFNPRDPQYQTDARPILEDCTCFACTHHSRAYIHHLLNVQEMLASTLLQMHNWHHYLSWFAHLRSH